jgi:F-type H+-transporting ATPase subunit b
VADPNDGVVAHVGAPEPQPEATAFGLAAPQWIALAMLAVFALLLWKRVPALIAAALDRKIAAIREQLEEAAQLRSEAEALKAEYQAKADAADAERETMLERARHEAETIVEQARVETEALIDRRRRMAEDKIAAAERHAIDEVRARAATAAAAAAARLIAEDMGPDADRAMIDRTIESLDKTH